MDREYIRQRAIRNRRNYRIKVAVTMGSLIAFLVVCTIWLCVAIARASEGKEVGDGKATNVGGEETPGGKQEEPKGTGETAEPTAEPTPEATSTPTPTPETTAPMIMIDPGHGGDDTGARRSGIYEEDINIAIANYVKEKLLALGYRTSMIRAERETVDRELRPGMAVEAGADLYVSIHQNTVDPDNNSIQGTEVYYNENNNAKNKELAILMAKKISEAAGSRNRGEKVGNNLIVLKPLEIPACLIECGFMSSPDELERLTDATYQEKIADGIVDAITSFLPIP